MKRTYLCQFFDTYPDKIVTESELFEAVRFIPVTREQLKLMIQRGINDGWLEYRNRGSVVYYFKKHCHE